MPTLTRTPNDAIKKSTNYEEFRWLNNNREVSRPHVEALKRAFQEEGNFTRVQPILVNQNMEIIDGQHRFVAAEELGEPIYFTQVEGLNVEDARKMNMLHMNWNVMDYAVSYAKSGNQNYKKYLELREEFHVTHSIMVAYIANTDKKGTFAEFRRGDLAIDDEAGLRERLAMLEAVQNVVGNIGDNRTFAIALLRVSNAPGFELKRMLKKLAGYPESLKSYTAMVDAQRQLEDVYNYRQTEGTRLRLY